MTAEQKKQIDNASENELWRMLAEPCEEAQDALYIRDQLTQKSQAELVRRLDQLSSRLLAVEYAQQRPSLRGPTFLLALLAAVFASFSVPWESVQKELHAWSQDLRRPVQRVKNMQQTSEWKWTPATSPEPTLPDLDPSAPLADALLLLPRTDARPERFPEL